MLLRGARMGAGAGVYAGAVACIVAAMPLDDLLRLVETLRERIEAHGPALRASEALTRYALIDPLLRELGWDTSDPTQVVPEYSLKKGFFVGGREFADYALLKDEFPTVILEAKKLGTSLREETLDQAINYCFRTGIPYAAATDGRRWEIYQLSLMGPGKSDDDLRIVDFDVTGPPAEVCLKAMALWRQGVLAGSLRPAESPVTANTESAPTPPKPETVISPTVAVGDEWLSLATLIPEGGSKPTEIQFPTGERVAATAWADFMAALVGWLENAGHLSQADAPISYGKMHILATSPIHPDGQPFRQRRQTRLFHINTNYSGPDNVRNAGLIVQRAGLDPAQFRVRLRD